MALVGALVLLWSLLAIALVLPLRVYAFLADRLASCAACWRLAVASLLPGALLMGIAVLFYGLRRLTLVDLLLVNVFHLFVGLVYLLIAPLRLPRRGPPFSSPPDRSNLSSDSPVVGTPAAKPAPPAPAEANPFRPSPSPDRENRKNPFNP